MAASLSLAILILCIFICPSYEVLDSYLPVLDVSTGISRDELIEQYFHMGFQQTEILAFLLMSHGIVLSLRQLKRILARRGLRRRLQNSELDRVLSAIEEELQGSGRTLGYRSMWLKLITDYNLVVSKETVRYALKILDPLGVSSRLRHRLQRREYKGRGPNYIWHINGYDKLKPFGFCIHGCIDGFSRRVMWLELGMSNNDPSIISKYFIDCIRQVGGTARIVRSDYGTENTSVAAIQRFLRRDSDDSFKGDKSFMYGKSVSNQRIEAWWSQLRRRCTEWWMQYFKGMRDNGLFCDGEIIHVECLRFCFMDLVREDLQKTAKLWNIHRIRPSTNLESPPGRPDVLYFLPEVSSTTDLKIDAYEDDLDLCEELCSDSLKCLPEFAELAEMIMTDAGLQMPSSPEEAKVLYLSLLNEISNI